MSGTVKDVDDDCHLPMIRYAYNNEALISSLDDLEWLEIGKGLTPIRITKRREVWILFESLNEPWCLNPKRITMNKDNTLIIKADLDFMMGDFQNN